MRVLEGSELHGNSLTRSKAMNRFSRTEYTSFATTCEAKLHEKTDIWYLSARDCNLSGNHELSTPGNVGGTKDEIFESRLEMTRSPRFLHQL